MPIIKRFQPEPRDDVTSSMERDTSGQLVRLIDVLFALVIVQGALFYRPLLAAHGHRNAAAIIALALVMYTVVRSFVDWHMLMEHSPYQIMTSGKRSVVGSWGLQVRTLELCRLYVDFLIVAAYSVLLLRAHVLLNEPAAELKFFFWSFSAVFVLYLLWGELLRRSTGNEQQFSSWLLLIALITSAALALVYTLTVNANCFAAHGTARNIVALLFEAAIMVGYRYFNWKQQKTIGDGLAG